MKRQIESITTKTFEILVYREFFLFRNNMIQI